jgi:hypothetical protein
VQALSGNGISPARPMVWQAECSIIRAVRVRFKEDHMATKKLKKGKKLGRSKTLSAIKNLRRK